MARDSPRSSDAAAWLPNSTVRTKAANAVIRSMAVRSDYILQCTYICMNQQINGAVFSMHGLIIKRPDHPALPLNRNGRTYHDQLPLIDLECGLRRSAAARQPRPSVSSPRRHEDLHLHDPRNGAVFRNHRLSRL